LVVVNGGCCPDAWGCLFEPVSSWAVGLEEHGVGSGQAGKKALSEADICAKYITPAIEQAGWDDQTQLRREVHFTKAQIHVRGKMVTRGKSKFADYVLYYKPNIPIGIVEAKDNVHSVGDGMQQALVHGKEGVDGSSPSGAL